MDTAKIFKHGGSQAVRLPAAYRFDASEVYVRRDPITGDLVLSLKAPAWKVFFALRDAIGVGSDLAGERDDRPPQPRGLFGKRR